MWERNPAAWRRLRATAVGLLLGGATLGAELSPAMAVPPGAPGPIAFERYTTSGGNEVWVTNPDGSQAGRLVRGPGLPVRWSPDGRQLDFVFSSDVCSADVHVGARTLVCRYAAEQPPAWSPDRTRYAQVGMDGSLSIVRPGAGTITVVPAALGSGMVLSPEWSPDGSRLAYVRTYPGVFPFRAPELRTVHADGSGDAVLSSWPVDQPSRASWSPDGDLIAVSVANSSTPITLFFVDLVGAATGAKTRPAGLAGGSHATWSPDGARLAYARDGRLWTATRDGVDAVELGIAPADRIGYMQWSSGPLLTREVSALDLAHASQLDGVVRIRRPGASGVGVMENGTATVAAGTRLDTRRGLVDVALRNVSGQFGGGVFTYAGSKRGVVRINLGGPPALCASAPSRGGRRLSVLADDGRFRVRGRRSAATGEDARWTVEDRCDGSTRTTVRQGRVTVRDPGRGRSVRLRAGDRYVAKALQ